MSQVGSIKREGEKVRARKAAGRHGDSSESEGIEEAKGEHVASEGEEVYAQLLAREFRDGHSVRAGIEEQGHVSETELLIAHVLAAMKDCSLLGKEDKSARTSKGATQTSSQDVAGIRTSSAAWAAQASSSEAHATASTSSSASTSSQVKGDVWASSQAEMAVQTSSPAHGTSQTSHMATRSSSQENVAALCIASLKHTNNKENYRPSNRSLDMQDERAQPKFRNIADLYKLSEP